MRSSAVPCAALLLAACGTPAPAPPAAVEESHAADGVVRLTPQQIAAAGIEIASPTIGGSAGAIDLPALVEGDPAATRVVSAGLGGRIVALSRNLGETVHRGETLAVLESREAAQLKGAVEAAAARLTLAEATLARERRLFAERVSPEQDLLQARTAATEARIALRLARQQLGAAGGGGGSLNRIDIAAPIAGHVVARTAVLGQTVSPDAELYRIADLSAVSLSLSLLPADAARVRPGAAVHVSAAGRSADGQIRFVSPALDAETRLVPAIARLDNRQGLWRVGEPVSASIRLAGAGDRTIRVPSTAVQTVEGRAVVFVRIATGFVARPIATGRQDGDMVIVTSGLSGRERIAAANSFTLKSALGAGDAGHED